MLPGDAIVAAVATGGTSDDEEVASVSQMKLLTSGAIRVELPQKSMPMALPQASSVNDDDLGGR